MEAEDDADARRMIPPVIRPNAKVIQLFEFNAEHLELLHQLTLEQFRQLRHLTPEQFGELRRVAAEQLGELVLKLSGKQPST